MADTLHAIVTDEDEFGYSVTSPQMPGFVGIYDDEQALRRNFAADIRRAGWTGGPVVSHQQRRGTSSAGQEYVIRWAQDAFVDDRVEVGRRTAGMFDSEEGDDLVDDPGPDAAGVITALCCVSTDTLGWVVEQMDERGDIVLLVCSVADDFVSTIAIATDGQRDWPTLAARGLSFETTVGSLMSENAETPEHISI